MGIQAILSSISIGLLATTSPCVFPLYPGYLAYIASSAGEKKNLRYFLGFFVLAGVLTMMLALGAIIAALSVSVGSALAIVIPIADAILIILGILLILDRNPFKKLPQINIPFLKNPAINAFVYGLLYGPIALPCSGPLVVSIFALSLQNSGFLGRLSTFLWFGIGFGIPLLVLSLLGGSLQKQITRLMAKHSRIINIISGIIILGLGIYDLIINWEAILLQLG